MLLIDSCKNPTTIKETEYTFTSHDSSYTWTKLLDSGAWAKSYNFQLFSMRDTLWVLHPDGNWFSANGTDWTKSSLPNAINNLAFLKYVAFNGAMYGLGHWEGNIEQFSFRPTIYITTDMQHWDSIPTKSNLPKRFFYHPFVFNNKIWIIGGQNSNTAYADIWNSPDGIVWTKQKDSLPFGKRTHSQIIELNGVLYLLDNDVWTSTDGLEWKLLTNEILKGQQVFGYAAAVMDNKIWLLGCNRNGQFSSQVLVSSDGKEWEAENAPWSPRGGIASTVHKGKIYITGGKYGGTPDAPDFRYSNDVWMLGKK